MASGSALRRRARSSRRLRSPAGPALRLRKWTVHHVGRPGRRTIRSSLRPVSPATGLQRVSAAGGEPTLLTKPDRERGEADHWWPELLPGGKAVLFTIFPANGTLENAQIALLDLQTGTWRVLIRGGSHAHYASTGHIVYGAMGTLRAVAFDLGRLEVDGTARLVLEGVVTTAMGAVDGVLAANGSLVYIPGGADDAGPQTVMRVDRKGSASPLRRHPTRGVPRRTSVTRGRPARPGHAERCMDLRFHPHDAEPTHDRSRQRLQPALDARRAANRLHVATKWLP